MFFLLKVCNGANISVLSPFRFKALILRILSNPFVLIIVLIIFLLKSAWELRLAECVSKTHHLKSHLNLKLCETIFKRAYEGKEKRKTFKKLLLRRIVKIMLSDRSKSPTHWQLLELGNSLILVGSYISSLTSFDTVLLNHLDIYSKVIQGADFSCAYLDGVKVWGLVTA